MRNRELKGLLNEYKKEEVLTVSRVLGDRKISNNFHNRKNSFKNMSLRERFFSKGYAVKKYALAHELIQPILSRVLDGKVKGTSRTKKGATKKIFMQLRKDGVFLEDYPWELKNDNIRP